MNHPVQLVFVFFWILLFSTASFINCNGESKKNASEQQGADSGITKTQSHTKLPSKQREDQDQDAQANAASEGAGWTVMLYSMSDCDLEEYQLEDIAEAAQVGSNENLNFIALVDRAEGHSNAGLMNLNDWTTAKLLKANKNSYEELQDLGEINMGEPQTLVDFVAFSVSTFPAQHYALIFSDHGGGWVGFGGDESTDDHAMFDLQGLQTALSQSLDTAGLEKFDFVGFDACLMATYEVALALSPYSDYFVASEETEPGHGWDYRALQVVADNPNTTTEEFAKAILDAYDNHAKEYQTHNEITLSMVNNAHISALEQSLNAYTRELSDSIQPIAHVVGKARERTMEYGKAPNPAGCVQTIDLGEFVEEMNATVPESAQAGEAVLAALKQAVPYYVNGRINKKSQGLSIYFPTKQRFYESAYDNLAFASSWRDLIHAYFNAGSMIPQEAQADFVNDNQIGEVDIDEEGMVSLYGELTGSSLENIVDASLYFGVLDEEDNLLLIGDMTAMVEENMAIGVYPAEIMYLEEDGVRSYGYISMVVEDNFMDITIPFHFYAPGSNEPEFVFASISGDLDAPDDEWEEIYYGINENETLGQIYPEEGGKIVPLLLSSDFQTGATDGEWIETTDVMFDFDGDFDMDFEKLEPEETLYLEIGVEDYGGNYDFVYYAGTLADIPKAEPMNDEETEEGLEE